MKLDVKPGDKLALRVVRGWGRTHRWEMMIVERTTATQAVCGNRRVRLDDGSLIGDRWVKVVPVTPEIEQQAERERRADDAARWVGHDAEEAIKQLSVARIEQVRALVEKLTAEQEQESQQPAG